MPLNEVAIKFYNDKKIETINIFILGESSLLTDYCPNAKSQTYGKTNHLCPSDTNLLIVI
jgi:hypothetical protein